MASDPRMIFVTGKGGTGKSTVAAALALSHARQGKRVQLIELASRSFYLSADKGAVARSASNGSAASMPALLDGIDLLQLDPLVSLKQYVKRFALFESAANLLLDSKPARGVLNTLPGLKELAIIGKLTNYLELSIDQGGYDITVVDCFATGHFLALLRAPRALAESISSGPLGRQCRKMLRQLQDPARCRYLIVALPEELPLAESLALSATLADEFGIHADYLCNKLLPGTDLRPDLSCHPAQPNTAVPAAVVDPSRSDSGRDSDSDFAGYLADWRQRQSRVLKELSNSISNSSSPLIQLPYCFDTSLDRQIMTLADALDEGVD